MEITAHVTDVRQSPRKVRLVAQAIAGLPAPAAVMQLEHMNKRAARSILDVLRSAMANAQHNAKLDPSTLIVKSCLVDQGFVMKRFRARAFGRAGAIRKRTSRVKIVLDTPVSSSDQSTVS